MELKIGDQAPDFQILDQNGKEFKLSEQKGKKVLLAFHPLAWTSVCKKQMKQMESNTYKFKEKNTVFVAISVDPIPTKKALAKSLGLKKIRMLSDFWPHGDVAKKYHIFRGVEGFSERADIVIDENGVIMFIKVYNLPELPNIENILNIL